MNRTTIPVSKEVRDQLRQLASQGETYDDLLRRLMEGAEARYLYERESASSKPRRSSLLTERRILLSKTATHQLERVPRDAHRRIRERLNSLDDDGRCS